MAGHPIFAWFYGRRGPRADLRGTADKRRRLLASASGSVIEVGAGTGLNLRYYPPAVTEVLATEPDPHMFRRLARALDESRVPVQLRRATADELPAPDGSVDTVVCSLVLCSVPDVSAALSEARRVLRPGGRLLFFEHVRALDPRFARWQDRFEGAWGLCGAGCHPNRDTVGEIEASGLRIEELDRFDEPGAMLARPHVLGSAVSG
jgi:SAM-dependent methyltransferase